MIDLPEGNALLAELAKAPNDQHLLSVYADLLEQSGATDAAQLVRLDGEMRRAKPPVTDEIKACAAKVVELGKRLVAGGHGTWLEQINAPNVRDTTWTGYTKFPDAEPSDFIARFLADGAFNYTQGGDTSQSGTWVQFGSVVLFEMNRHYADYTGLIVDGAMHGTATNIKSAEWMFYFTRASGPTVVPEDTDMTITPWTEAERRPKAKSPNRVKKVASKPRTAKKPPTKKPTKKPAKKPTKKLATKAKPATKRARRR